MQGFRLDAHIPRSEGKAVVEVYERPSTQGLKGPCIYCQACVTEPARALVKAAEELIQVALLDELPG
ncbi:hypothetical protein WJX84_007466 [Apatococcus fuscideae]|uniref:Uncharacterized protein n=1 Tax=Apatococcus fuscideae TaxID=2026836 RepID=A0AAW1SSL9_9CHLO